MTNGLLVDLKQISDLQGVRYIRSGSLDLLASRLAHLFGEGKTDRGKAGADQTRLLLEPALYRESIQSERSIEPC